MKYILNSKLIVRDQDKSIFTPSKFKIFKFNSEGYEIIKSCKNTSKSITEICEETNMDSENIKNFVNKCLNEDIFFQLDGV